jgi:hypothetical protein
MRKQYKRKSRSCGLCKPHKIGWERRWKSKDRQFMRSSDTEIRAAGPRTFFDGSRTL